MKRFVTAGAAALLLWNAVSMAAPPADSTAKAAPAAAAPAAAAGAKAIADSSANRAAVKPLPSAHPARPKGKRSRIRKAAHDTLSTAEIKKLGLAPAPPPPAGKPPKVMAVALDIRHQVFGNFREGAIVGMKEDFRVGDTDYTARVIDFVPDWAMGLETFKVFSRSNEPRNPGFRIVVREKGEVRDTVWAFLHMPPHFARNSMLSFKVLKIEFADHAPVPFTPADTTAKSPARKPETPAAGGGKK